jgi:hypothetical protein
VPSTPWRVETRPVDVVASNPARLATGASVPLPRLDTKEDKILRLNRYRALPLPATLLDISHKRQRLSVAQSTALSDDASCQCFLSSVALRCRNVSELIERLVTTTANG